MKGTGTDERRAPRLSRVWRQQVGWKLIDLERAVGSNHKARAIVELVSGLDLRQFEEPIRSLEHGPGRNAEDPALLISVWIYGYSEGMGSARELAQQMEYEPGLMWILGERNPVSHSKLSEFRTAHGAALQELFSQLLVLLDSGGWMDLSCVMQDGTKIQAQAGQDSFRREGTIEEKLAAARAAVEQLAEAEPDGDARRRAAEERAKREKLKRLEQARAEMERLKKAAKEEDRKQIRVSVTEPDARRMKHGNDGGIAPSYNLQLSTDAKQGVIVGVDLTQEAGDFSQLVPAVERMERDLKRTPDQMVADGGYTTRETIVAMAERGIDFIGSLGDQRARQQAALKSSGIAPDFGPGAFVQIQTEKVQGSLRCPAGKLLPYWRQNPKRGLTYWQYRANGSDCSGCVHQQRCCPGKPEKGRVVSVLQELSEVIAFREKMQTELGPASLQTTWSGGRVSQRLDQRKTGTEEIPPRQLEEGAYRSLLGLPDLQRDAVGAIDEAGDAGAGRVKWTRGRTKVRTSGAAMSPASHQKRGTGRAGAKTKSGKNV